MTRRSRFLATPAVVAALAALLAGCIGFTGDPTRPPSTDGPVVADATAPHVELTVYAAASLKGALEAAKAAYERDDETVSITISTDSSAALEAQIEQGAPADLFLSADTANPARLRAAAMTAADPVPFAGNRLVILLAPGNEAGLSTAFDLAKPGVRIVAAGEEVPITTYAYQAVRNLAGLPGALAGFEAGYSANVVSREDNVRAVVAKVQLGEGDAAIVYATDARAARDATTIDIPAEANVAATYAGVVVKASRNQQAATAFLAWLAGADGQSILSTFGFLPPPG